MTRSALMMVRYCMRFVFFLGVLVVAACHSGDVEQASHPAELGQGEDQEEVEEAGVLGLSADDYFGYAVAMSGDYVLIGQPHDETHGTKAGAAYIYQRQGDLWKEVSKLTPDDATADALFGITVAIDGDIAVVGAPGADAGHGAVYVFVRQETGWTQVQRLTVSRPDPNDDFAVAIALSGPSLFVGAPGDQEAGSQSGAVYVFALQDDHWSVNEVQKLFSHEAQASARFGGSVAVADDVALIGAPAHDGVGAAYIFERQYDVWTEEVRLQANEWRNGGDFGYSVAISGAIAVVGAPYDGDAGAVYIFERRADGWPATTTDLLTAGDGAPGAQFGAAVAISGRIVLVGAESNTFGAAYLFTSEPGEAWRERHQLPLADEQQSPHFGYTVALTGAFVLIGAPAILTGDNGYVYPYRDLIPNPVSIATPPPPVTPPSAEERPLVAGDVPGAPAVPDANRAPQIISAPITESEMLYVMPEIHVADADLVQQTITLNGQPFSPGTAIIAAGSYELIVEATDAAGNTSRSTVRFSIEDPTSP